MSSESADFYSAVSPDDIAINVGNLWTRWDMARAVWMKESQDIRATVFSSTIDTTTNSDNPFLNRTTIPKLTQVHDNLLANYDASLFPNQDWFKFDCESPDAAKKDVKNKITSYIKTKTRQLKFRSLARQYLSDWILDGNCFAGLEYVTEFTIDPTTKEKIPGYVGPKPYRIAPCDIVFNVTAKEFRTAPKIVRTLKSIGQLKKEVDTHPELGYTQELITTMLDRRKVIVTSKAPEVFNDTKTKALIADGFGSLLEYYNSGLVEILEFYGDMYLAATGEFFSNHKITVIDRATVIRNEPVKSWSGSHDIFHCGWRARPDNLMGMSPLANLLGMQHRIDKNENTKADVLDALSYPITIEKGDVEYIDGMGVQNGVRGLPGGQYRADGDGDVAYLAPNPAILNLDSQIQLYQSWMEELAGAPKNTMGIRTPGEKTAFEVQTLDNAASRIFQNKIGYFEEEFLEPLLNAMLEKARQHLDPKDIIKMTDDMLGVDTFIDITKDDLAAAGRIYAVGSRYFARNATLVQNLTTLSQSPLLPFIAPHMDRWLLTSLMSELLGVDKFSLFRENIGVEQDLDTQRLVEQAKQTLMAESQTPAEGQIPGDPNAPA